MSGKYRFMLLRWAGAACFFLGAGFPANADECTTLRAGGSQSWVPYSYLDPKEAYTGVAPGFLGLAADRLGIGIEWQKIPWKRLLLQLERGETDIVLGAYWTAEREQKFQYLGPIGDDLVSIFVKKGREFPFAEWEDLTGRQGLRPHGGSYGQAFDLFAEQHLTMRQMVESSDFVKALLLERADYAVFGLVDGLARTARGGAAGQIVPLPEPLTHNRVYLMLTRTGPCAALAGQLATQFRRLTSQGHQERLYRMHLPN